MYTIYKDVYLDVFDKRYRKILVVDPYPEFLRNYIRKLKLPKLSTIHYNRAPYCVYCFKSVYNPFEPMEVEELPYLINILNKNNCEINYKLNKLLSNHVGVNFILSFTDRFEVI